MKSSESHSAYLKKNKLQLRDTGLTEIGFSVYLKWASFHCNMGSTRIQPTWSPAPSVHKMRTVKTEHLLRVFLFFFFFWQCRFSLLCKIINFGEIFLQCMLQDITQNYNPSEKSTFSVTSSNYKARCNHSHCYHLSGLMHPTSWGLSGSERALQSLGETQQISINTAKIYHTCGSEPFSINTSYNAY